MDGPLDDGYGPLDDGYVASLLKDDAKKANQNASLIGMRAYMPLKTNAEAPKPNKRFLRNIIRETNSHNQALLAKEAEESRVRLKDLREKEAREARKLANRGRTHRDHSEERHRMKRRRVDLLARDSNRLSPPKDFELSEDRRERPTEREIYYGESRREDNDSEDERSTRRPHKRARQTNTLDQAITKSLRRAENHRRHRSRSRDRSNSGGEDRHRKSTRPDRDRKSMRHDRSRNRSASPERSRDRERSHKKYRQRKTRSRSRSRSQSKERSHRRKRSPEIERASRHRRASPRRSDKHDAMDVNSPKTSSSGKRSNRWDVAPSPPTAIRSSRTKQRQQDSDSDPLENIVGPIPPPPAPVVKVRGRGAISSSAMDSHFCASYDPNADIEPEVGPTDDWEMALEAMRDRAKFKQTQGDRLRAAGFSEDEVMKWEKGGEKTEEDVRWAKKGEGREWDRGKVVDDMTGHVDLAPEWGRLKGT
ncbi:60s ribosomal protein l37 [Venturia nashicola]|nr:60s ribosomal protein l37 [Venturia nashicola]